MQFNDLNPSPVTYSTDLSCQDFAKEFFTVFFYYIRTVGAAKERNFLKEQVPLSQGRATAKVAAVAIVAVYKHKWLALYRHANYCY